jgi:4-aminobutyrate aminotransferase-like enzyme
VESRNVTYLSDDFPVFWTDAAGANVRDADGNVYVDLTAAFGVALAGHADPDIAAAVSRQQARLVHGMGDVHPPAVKVELLERLSALLGRALGWSEPRSVLANSGSEAVEAALKTARLASKRSGIVAFEGGYHGLTLGSLAVTSRDDFRAPVAERLFGGVARLPFPEVNPSGTDAELRTVGAVLDCLDRVLACGVAGHEIGTILVEPVQARGGVRVLPREFAQGLQRRVAQHDLVLVCDEIYTGMGRCGSDLASPLVGLKPDIVCLGKVLGGGLPLSVCSARRDIMDAWPESSGEALHTSTFLGHPLACAAGLAVLDRVDAGLPQQAARTGGRMMHRLCDTLGLLDGVSLRGMGLLIGIDLIGTDGAPRPGAGARVAEAALARGVIVLPAGSCGSVIELSPPAVITEAQQDEALSVIEDLVRAELGVPGAIGLGV